MGRRRGIESRDNEERAKDGEENVKGDKESVKGSEEKVKGSEGEPDRKSRQASQGVMSALRNACVMVGA